MVRATAEEREWLVTNFNGCEYIPHSLYTITVPDCEVVADLLYNCLRDAGLDGQLRSFYRRLYLKVSTAKSIISVYETLELWEFVPTSDGVVAFSPEFVPDPLAFAEEEEF